MGGSSFECVGDARELTLVDVFFQIFVEQGHTFGYLGRLNSGHIVHFHFFNVLVRREGVIWI